MMMKMRNKIFKIMKTHQQIVFFINMLNMLQQKQKGKKARVVKIITPNDSTTTFYKAQDSNIIVTAENDDDDVEFIVHDDLEPKTSSAVAAALDLHEKKARGIATFKRKKNNNKNKINNSLQNEEYLS